jgi:hypothetical protein
MYTYVIKQTIDEYKDPKAVIDPITGEASMEPVKKSSIAIQAEKAAIISAKTAEIQADVDAYIAAQASQGIGESGPVAECEIMKIVNEHGGDFEVVLEE